MTTPLEIKFNTTENEVSQCDNQTFGSIAETLVIHFDQEKVEQFLSGGSARPLNVHKHKKISLTRPPLANA